MVASGFKAISLGLIVFPASAGNPSLRGLASAEGSTQDSTLPSWCSNIPTSSWAEIPDCGGTTNGGSSDGSIPSWCASVPAESTLYIPACAHQNSVAPGVSPSVYMPAVDPNATVQPITSNLPSPNIEASPSAERSTEVNLEASQLPITPEIHVPAVVPGVSPSVYVPSVNPNSVVQGQLPGTPSVHIPPVVPGVSPSVDVPSVDPNAIVQPITSNLPLPNIGANPSAERSTNVNLEASQLPSTPEIHVPAVVPGVSPAVDVPSVNPNSIVQGQLPGTPSVHVPPVGPGDNMLLASSSIPTWCNDIPSDGQTYIAACGGGAESNSQNSNVGAAPSWCENIPAGSRANVPSCANREGAPISRAPGLASSTGLVMTVIASFFSAVV